MTSNGTRDTFLPSERRLGAPWVGRLKSGITLGVEGPGGGVAGVWKNGAGFAEHLQPFGALVVEDSPTDLPRLGLGARLLEELSGVAGIMGGSPHRRGSREANRDRGDEQRLLAKAVAPAAHAILLVDQAGWHMSKCLVVPANITIIALPPKCPELNPVENVWQFMRDNWLSNRVFQSYDDLVDHCCAAWSKLVDQPWRIMTIGLRQWAHRF